jgi:hypothetical protein
MFSEEGAKVGEKAITPEPSPDADLSAEVVATIAREAGDRVRCTRIGGNKYRCNWWAARDGAAYERGALNGLASTMSRVRKSRVLHVTRSPAGLQITEAPSRQ